MTVFYISIDFAKNLFAIAGIDDARAETVLERAKNGLRRAFRRREPKS